MPFLQSATGKKLTSEQVKDLRLLYFKELKSLSYLAEKYNVSNALVYKAVTYETYKNVEDHPQLTEEMKAKRVPARIEYSMKKAKRMGRRHI